MGEPFLGQLFLFAGTFAPRGYALCNGQLLPVAQNEALYAILGTTYGGDGQTSFALPDLRGRGPIHQGSGPGFPSYALGQQAGTTTNTLTTAQMPAHSHSLNAVSESGDVASPAGALLASTGGLDPEYRTNGTPVQMAPTTIGPVGSSQPVNNRQPYLAINYIIALEGIFPSRN